MATVRMYSRRTCGLCDEARTVLLAERERAAFVFEEVFIDGDEELEREYGLRVPVVTVDGRKEFEFTVDPVRIRSLVLGPRRPWWPSRRPRLRRTGPL